MFTIWFIIGPYNEQNKEAHIDISEDSKPHTKTHLWGNMLFTNEERFLWTVTIFYSEESLVYFEDLDVFSPVWFKPCQNECTYLLEILSEFEAWWVRFPIFPECAVQRHTVPNPIPFSGFPSSFLHQTLSYFLMKPVRSSLHL